MPDWWGDVKLRVRLFRCSCFCLSVHISSLKFLTPFYFAPEISDTDIAIDSLALYFVVGYLSLRPLTHHWRAVVRACVVSL
jgi:hypothetical protein